MKTNNTMLRGDKFSFVKFEADVRKIAAKNDWTLSYISEEFLARSNTYLSSCFCKRVIPLRAAAALCRELGLKLSDYEIKPEPPKQEPKPVQKEAVVVPGHGWGNTLNVNIGAMIVSMAVYKDGVKVAQGRAKIFDTTGRGIMQAISYAAHMCYKEAEQKELEDKFRSNTVGAYICKTMNSTENTQTFHR